jgi:hypothetical protein
MFARAIFLLNRCAETARQEPARGWKRRMSLGHRPEWRLRDFPHGIQEFSPGYVVNHPISKKLPAVYCVAMSNAGMKSSAGKTGMQQEGTSC